MKNIAILSTVHPFDDTRIFHRQAISLSSKYNVNLYISAPFKTKKINNNLTIWGLPTWKNKADRLKSILKLLFFIKDIKTDLFIIHDPELLVLTPIIKLFKGKPIVYDIHENYVEMIHEKLWIPSYFRTTLARTYQTLEKLTFPFIDMIWYPVKNIGNHYHQYNKISRVQIRNVPALSAFQENNTSRIKKDQIIFLGYLIDDRGIREILKAFKIVLTKFPNYELVFVGAFQSDSFENEIMDMVRQLNLSQKIHFLGKIPYEKVSDYLYTAKIGLLNYLPIPNNINGLPNKIFEYMAAGLPVIASNFENYREVIEEAQSGILVNPTIPDEIANAIITLLGNNQKIFQMGENGRTAVRDRYCWEKESSNMFKAIENIFN